MPNVLRQCLQLISVFPCWPFMAIRLTIITYVMIRFISTGPIPSSPRRKICCVCSVRIAVIQREAHVLDAALILHMEHGGGNNSTFTTRVVTSAGSDTYSVMAAALTSLKGPKHGGANIKVMEMMKDLKEYVKDTTNETQVRDYLAKLLDGKAFDHKGLIYGLGHAIYAVSDPRAEVFRGYVQKLAEEKGRMEDFALYSNIERMAPERSMSAEKFTKASAPTWTFTAALSIVCWISLWSSIRRFFAVARSVGWSAHRLERTGEYG